MEQNICKRQFDEELLANICEECLEFSNKGTDNLI